MGTVPSEKVHLRCIFFPGVPSGILKVPLLESLSLFLEKSHAAEAMTMWLRFAMPGTTPASSQSHEPWQPT